MCWAPTAVELIRLINSYRRQILPSEFRQVLTVASFTKHTTFKEYINIAFAHVPKLNWGCPNSHETETIKLHTSGCECIGSLHGHDERCVRLEVVSQVIILVLKLWCHTSPMLAVRIWWMSKMLGSALCWANPHKPHWVWTKSTGLNAQVLKVILNDVGLGKTV